MTRISSFKLAAAIGGTAALIKVSALAAALAILAAGPADAGSLGRACTTAPAAQWRSVAALPAKIEALGETARSGRSKNACGAFDATEKTGARVERFVDPTGGTVAGEL